MSPDVTPASEAAFHAQVLLLVQRWHRLGLIDAPTRQVLLRYQRARIEGLLAPPPEVPPTPAAPPIVHPEPDAPAATDPVPSSPATGARAPTPPPRPRPPATDTPFPLPARPRREGRSTAAVLGSFLRERTWWLVGAGLTVVGSFFVAGTLWSDLGTAPRLLLVLAGLALYAQAFASAGHRIRRQPEGRRAGAWLLGVSVALAPVLAMAAGSGWALGGLEGLLFTAPALLAVVLLLAWRLRRDLPALLPSCDAGFRWIYLTLCATVGLLPALPSPFWLILPAGLAGAGLWWALTRWRRLPPGAALLLLHPIAFHLYLAPHGSSGAYAPALAVAALAVLYLDAALGRWRGLHAQRLRGLRGVAALALAGASLALLAPGLRPLPSGPESAVVGLLLVPFFLGAALCWRRPALIHGALLAALLFTLALPDLFHAIVELFSAAARQALGYDDEPLPLAWYSLTLLPLLLVTRASAAGLGRSGWRQAAALSAHAWRWTFALSGLLLLAAHSRPDDLRPALLALPLHGLLWLRERRVRALLRGTLPWAIPLLWTVDLLWHTGVAPSWRLGVAAALTLALIPAGATLARRLAETALLEGARIVAVAAALLLPLVLGGWEEPATALMLAGATTWLVSLGLRPLRAPPSAALYQLESALAVLGQTMLVGGLLCWAVPLGVGPLAWAGGLVGLAFCAAALAWWLPRVRARSEASAAALEVWAHTLALAAVVALCWLDGWDRSLMKLPIAALLVWWLTLRRWRVYGALLVFGLCEAVVRRLWLADALEPGGLAVVATALCWLPAALLIAAKRAEPRFAIHWLHRSLGQPAAWLGALCALAALPALLLQRPPGHGGQLAALALVTMLLLASRAAPTRAVELERSGWIAALACAVAWTLSEPVALLLPWLVPLPPALALLALLRPAPHRLELAAAAALAALLCGLVLGPLGHPELLATGAAGATLLALRRSRGWTQAALLSWLALAHSALAAQIAPSLGGHLVLISASSALLWAMLHAGPAPLRPAARQLGLGTAIAGAAGWSLWCATLAPQDLLAGWPVGLAAATLLLLAHRQGAAARLLAPWAFSALLLSGGADPVLHPIAWLGFATVAWLLSPRAGADRVGTRLLAGLALAGLLVAAVLRPELRPLLAFPVAATGLLAAQTGAGHRWAWGALALALLTAAAVEPLEPVAVLLRASLAFTAVAGLRHVAPEDAAPTPRGLLWLTITVAIGLSSGAWAISGLALVAGGLLLLRARWCLTTRGPALLEEPAGWLLLAGAVASRAWDQGSQAPAGLAARRAPAGRLHRGLAHQPGGPVPADHRPGGARARRCPRPPLAARPGRRRRPALPPRPRRRSLRPARGAPRARLLAHGAPIRRPGPALRRPGPPQRGARRARLGPARPAAAALRPGGAGPGRPLAGAGGGPGPAAGPVPGGQRPPRDRPQRLAAPGAGRGLHPLRGAHRGPGPPRALVRHRGLGRGALPGPARLRPPPRSPAAPRAAPAAGGGPAPRARRQRPGAPTRGTLGAPPAPRHPRHRGHRPAGGAAAGGRHLHRPGPGRLPALPALRPAGSPAGARPRRAAAGRGHRDARGEAGLDRSHRLGGPHRPQPAGAGPDPAPEPRPPGAGAAALGRRLQHLPHRPGAGGLRPGLDPGPGGDLPGWPGPGEPAEGAQLPAAGRRLPGQRPDHGAAAIRARQRTVLGLLPHLHRAVHPRRHGGPQRLPSAAGAAWPALARAHPGLGMSPAEV